MVVSGRVEVVPLDTVYALAPGVQRERRGSRKLVRWTNLPTQLFRVRPQYRHQHKCCLGVCSYNTVVVRAAGNEMEGDQIREPVVLAFGENRGVSDVLKSQRLRGQVVPRQEAIALYSGKVVDIGKMVQ